MNVPSPSLPSLRSGHGLPSRSVVLCDGRTSLRLSQELDGFDNLVHYAPDSWFQYRNVLNHPGCAMRWSADGVPHRFEWMQVYPFGYENSESRESGAVTSRCLVAENRIVWTFGGLRKTVVLTIPSQMFVTLDRRDPQGAPMEVSQWAFPAATKRPAASWCAVRDERWRLRDSSTYAGIAGKTIASEDRTSALHLCVTGSAPVRVRRTAASWEFEVAAQAGEAAFAIGLGGTEAEARLHAGEAARDAAACRAAQTRRYATVAGETPHLAFGRHTALRQFFSLQPGYLESMRVGDQPGAFRANNDYYWVWGWDMTRPAFGILTSNRWPYVRSLLDFIDAAGYINQYDNSLTRDLRADGGQPGALEYMLAHDYLAWSGDLEATRAWQPKMEAALRKEATNPDPTGMWSGAAASTDFPEEFGRTFPARLAYTTSWHYAGLLCAEKLLLAWGNAPLATAIRGQAAKIRHHFERIFWNPQTGFWNEGVHATDPDLVCDIPLSTATAAMDSPYGEDLYGEKLAATAAFCAEQFLRDDGVSITARGEKRGWKEWTRQPNNWFAANDTMLARLFRATGHLRALDKLFYLYELNFGYQPCVFEGKPLHRPLHTSGSWQAFGAGAWYRNLVEAAAGLWADLGGIGLMPGGLGEPVRLQGLRMRDAILDFEASGQGLWPQRLLLDGAPLVGTTRLPPLAPGRHTVAVEYGTAEPAHPLLTLAVDARVLAARVKASRLSVSLDGRGYTPVSFFSPGRPALLLNGKPVACEWSADTGRGRARLLLNGKATLVIEAETATAR